MRDLYRQKVLEVVVGNQLLLRDQKDASAELKSEGGLWPGWCFSLGRCAEERFYTRPTMAVVRPLANGRRKDRVKTPL